MMQIYIKYFLIQQMLKTYLFVNFDIMAFNSSMHKLTFAFTFFAVNLITVHPLSILNLSLLSSIFFTFSVKCVAPSTSTSIFNTGNAKSYS
jgi:hypothetical protein